MHHHHHRGPGFRGHRHHHHHHPRPFHMHRPYRRGCMGCGCLPFVLALGGTLAAMLLFILF